MKSTILKAFALPVAAFALASAGAVSTTDAGISKTATLVPAYIYNDITEECEDADVQCEPGTGQLCLSSGVEAFGKNEAGDCVVQLRRPTN